MTEGARIHAGPPGEELEDVLPSAPEGLLEVVGGEDNQFPEPLEVPVEDPDEDEEEGPQGPFEKPEDAPEPFVVAAPPIARQIVSDNAAIARHMKMRKRQEEFLECVAEHGTMVLAGQYSGVKNGTWTRWNKEDPWFKEQVQLARQHFRERDPRVNPYNLSFVQARRRYFGMKTYRHQIEMINAIEATKDKRVTLVLLPPEHGKTTVIEDFCSITLARNPNERILVITGARPLAKEIIGRVAKRMRPMRESLFTREHGPFYEDGQERKGKPWSADHFTVAKCAHDERSASMETRSWNSQVYGARADTLIIDDIQEIRTIAQTDEMVKRIRGTFLNRVSRHGRTIIIGSRIGIGDVYERLIDLDIVDNVVILPALDSNGDALWPEMWPVHVLIGKDGNGGIRKQSGEDIWWSAYQQNPRANELATFDENMIEASKDHKRNVGKIEAAGVVALGLDPALGGGNAITVAQYGLNELHLLDYEIRHNLARVEDILLRVEDYARRYKPVYVIVETNAMQKGLARDERMLDLARTYGFKLIEHQTGREKTDAVLIGIPAMAGSFLRREVRVPWGTSVAQARMMPLINELLSWRPNIAPKLLKQDGVMSLWFVWKHWMESKKHMDRKLPRRELPRFMRAKARVLAGGRR